MTKFSRRIVITNSSLSCVNYKKKDVVVHFNNFRVGTVIIRYKTKYSGIKEINIELRVYICIFV